MKRKSSMIGAVVAASGLALGCGFGSANAAQTRLSRPAATAPMLLASDSVTSGAVQLAEAPDREHQAREWQEHYDRIRQEEREGLEMEQRGIEMEQRGIEMEQRGIEQEQKAQQEEEQWWERWKQREQEQGGDGGD